MAVFGDIIWSIIRSKKCPSPEDALQPFNQRGPEILSNGFHFLSLFCQIEQIKILRITITRIDNVKPNTYEDFQIIETVYQYPNFELLAFCIGRKARPSETFCVFTYWRVAWLYNIYLYDKWMKEALQNNLFVSSTCEYLSVRFNDPKYIKTLG